MYELTCCIPPCTCCRLTATDKIYTTDMGTSTPAQRTCQTHRSTNTAPVLAYPASTNTDTARSADSSTETEVRVFRALEQLKNVGVNTSPRAASSDAGVNTDIQHKQLDNQNFDFSISFDSKGVGRTDAAAAAAAPKHTWDRGINTQQVRTLEKGANTQPTPSATRGVNTERLATNQTTRGVNTDAAAAARYSGASSGDGGSGGSERTSKSELKTTVQVVKVTECENCRERYTDGMRNAQHQRHAASADVTRRHVSSDVTQSSAADQLFGGDVASRSELSKVISREIVRKTESKLGTSPRTSSSSTTVTSSRTSSGATGTDDATSAATARDSMTSSGGSSSTAYGQSASSSMMTSSSSSSSSSHGGSSSTAMTSSGAASTGNDVHQRHATHRQRPGSRRCCCG